MNSHNFRFTISPDKPNLANIQNNPKSMENSDKTTLIDFLKSRIPNLIGIYLFGSVAAGTDHKHSDIDIVVYCSAILDNVERWNIAQELASTLNQDVDLIDLKQANTVFSYQIITEGKQIFCMNPPSCDQFEDLIFSKYMTLNEDRREILDEIQKTGKILC